MIINFLFLVDFMYVISQNQFDSHAVMCHFLVYDYYFSLVKSFRIFLYPDITSLFQ